MSKTIELTTAGWIINGITLIPYNVNLNERGCKTNEQRR